jgi:PLP dependent protein
MPELEQNISKVRQRIAAAAERSGRKAEDITLVAVTKTQAAETVNQALRAGITYFGENKVQEAEQKLPLITAPYEGFHFIGHLQTNKVKALLQLRPCLIHSLDSLHLARTLYYEVEKLNRVQDVLLEINTARDGSKFGLNAVDLQDFIREISDLSLLRIKGLMTIGRQSDDPEDCRQDFRLLKSLGDTLTRMNIPNLDMQWLSMGMTGDFEIAIEEGANLVRIGSAIFGDRIYPSRPTEA